MALWLVRAGKHDEYVEIALEKNLTVIGWPELADLSGISSQEQLLDLLRHTYPTAKDATLRNWMGQIWAFLRLIQQGDLIAMPIKSRSVIVFGEVVGAYEYREDLPANLLRHARPVKWLGEIPRASFDKDILYSFSSLMTVCRVRRNEAEKRVRELLGGVSTPGPSMQDADEAEPIDIDQYAMDQIVKRIEERFKGHAMARLVAAILQAHGYQTFVSPEGPDEGLDIVAGTGPMGFEGPRIAVQVKSGNSPVGQPEIDQLRGAMKRIGANVGLFVSWAGFKGSVKKKASTFFEVRLWNAEDLVNALLQTYERLPEDIRAELPLKRIWVLVPEED